jgi:hypothetical protein
MTENGLQKEHKIFFIFISVESAVHFFPADFPLREVERIPAPYAKKSAEIQNPKR